MDQRMEKLLRSVKDTAYYAAGKAAEAAAATGQAVSAAGEKVSDYRDLHRLEREIQSLRQEVKLQLQAVGGMLYATHRGKPSASDELLATLPVIAGQ